jgi:hypothetical protein
MGVREQIIFPEVDYDAIDQVRGLDITITTTAATDTEAFALLSALGMPFAERGRPAHFDGGEAESPADAGSAQRDVEVEQDGALAAQEDHDGGAVAAEDAPVDEQSETAGEEADTH